MARYSRVFRMFIASPSDTAIHREAVYRASYRWNAVNSVDLEVFVEPVGWEYHVRPENNPSGGQHSIDTQLLDTSDFLIGIFHSKLGKSVAGGISGTIHEIERFIKLGNRSMIFFSNENFDSDINISDLTELRSFKDRCKRSNLYKEFGSLESLEVDVLAAISQHVSVLKDNFTNKIGSFKGLKVSPPKNFRPRKFKFPKELIADEVKFALCFFEPEFDIHLDPDHEWKIKSEVILTSNEIDRNFIFRQLKGNWNYSFKFYLDVSIERKQHYMLKLLEAGLILTGDGTPIGNGEKWRIWFLHDEGLIHPHYTGLLFANQSLYYLPVSL